MLKNCRRINLIGKSDAFWGLIRAERELWDSSFDTHDGDIIIEGICRKHILDKLLDTGVAEYTERIETLSNDLGLMWLRPTFVDFNKYWLEIAEYQEVDLEGLKKILTH